MWSFELLMRVARILRWLKSYVIFFAWMYTWSSVSWVCTFPCVHNVFECFNESRGELKTFRQRRRCIVLIRFYLVEAIFNQLRSCSIQFSCYIYHGWVIMKSKFCNKAYATSFYLSMSFMFINANLEDLQLQNMSELTTLCSLVSFQE